MRSEILAADVCRASITANLAMEKLIIDVIRDDGVFGEGSFQIAHICVGCAEFC